MIRFLCIAVLFYSGTAQGANSTLRLVLQSGWVIPLSADGSHMQGEAKKLELPEDSKGIHAVRVDYAQRFLYVVLDTSYTRRGTFVFELSSLRKLGFLPGVTEVFIPMDAKAKRIITATYFGFEDVDISNLAIQGQEIEYLMAEGARTVLSEVRDRRNFRKVILNKKEDYGLSSWLLRKCYSKKLKGYLGDPPYLHFDHSLNEVRYPTPQTQEERNRELFELGFKTACWPNGDILASRGNINDSYEDDFVGRQRVSGEKVDWQHYRKVDPRKEWQLASSGEAHTMGQDGRYAVFIAPEGNARMYDFDAGTKADGIALDHQSTRSDSASVEYFRPIAYSRDYQDLYLVGMDYTNAARSWAPKYMDIGSGAWRLLYDRVLRVSIRGNKPSYQELNFPKAVAEINQRKYRIQELTWVQGSLNDYDPNDEETKKTEAENKRMLSELPPLGLLGQKIDFVGIIGVIAE